MSDNIISRLYFLSRPGSIEKAILINKVKELMEKTPQEIGKEEIGINKIMLKDIINHAEEIKANIIRKKIDSVYHSGIDMKRALTAEGVTNDIDYQNFRNKIERILGKGELGRIRKSNKK